MSKTIVYGSTGPDGRLVFIPRGLALELRDTLKIAQDATTWGELRAGLPGHRIEALTELATENSDERPADTTTFVLGDVGAYADGDWPEWPAQLQLEWMPEDVHALGTIQSSVFNGDFLEFQADREMEVVDALTAHGYTVLRNQALVDSASGRD